MKKGIHNIYNENFFLSSKDLSSQISLRSEMAQEIISRKPNFMEKWALVIFLLIIMLLVAATWFIHYPDIIETHATLTAADAPKEIIPLQEGRLVKLFTQNGQKVNKNEVLGWIESIADHAEVIELSKEVDRSIFLLNTKGATTVSSLFSKRFYNLGEIQASYQSFTTALQLFNDYNYNGFYTKKRNLLRQDVKTIEQTNTTIQNQKKFAEQDIQLASETYDMNSVLFDQKVLSKEEYRTEKSKYINREMAIPQLEAALLSNESQKRDKIKEIDQIGHDMAQELVAFQQAVQSFKSTIDDWKKKFLIQSPVGGKVFFIIPLQENQFLQPGKLIGYINPDNNHFYSETYLPQDNFGKLDTGLMVQLRFNAYPYQEVGFVEGKLDYISNVASDSGFLATISFDKGLITNNNKVIPYKSGLKAQALIITKDMRLLQRFWYNINKSESIGSK